MCNFHYIVILGLKIACAIYQHAMTPISHDMLYECLEDYIDDVIMKSREVSQYIDDLGKVFLGCK